MPDFITRLKKVSEFFRKENLAQQTFRYDGNAALLVIDVQKEFCDPKGQRGNAETARIAKKISSLATEFRAAGIPVYAVYFSYDEKKKPAEVDFYEFAPQEGDVLVRKDHNSAFRGSNIKSLLENDGRISLLACGFNLNACVFDTVLDARDHSFNVCLLRDLSGNGKDVSGTVKDSLKTMREKGIAIEHSAAVLRKIRLPASTLR